MRKTLSRVLALLLCLAMCLTMTPPAFAEGAEDEELFTWEEPSAPETPSEPEPAEEPGPDYDPEPEEELPFEFEVDPALAPEEPETPEETEKPEDPDDPRVRVRFVCEPEDTQITVYDPNKLDAEGYPVVIEPEADGTYLLLPGEYMYDAFSFGYSSSIFTPFSVERSQKDKEEVISVLLRELILTNASGVSTDFLNNCSSVYKNGPYYTKLQNLSLVGNQPLDLVAVAQSQVGYHEGNSWDDISGNSSGTSDYTEYNRWYPVKAQAWCNLFVSWCFSAAGISTDIAPKNPFYLSQWRSNGAGVYSWKDYKNGAVVPVAGDVIIYGGSTTNGKTGSELSDSYQHVGIISDYQGGKFYTIEGNYSEKVSSVSYTPNTDTGYASGSGYIHAIIRPKYKTSFEILNSWPCDLTLKVTTDNLTVYKQPGNLSTYPESGGNGKGSTTLSKGTQVHAVKIVENKVAGHYWYEIDNGPQTSAGYKYIYSNDTSEVSQNWTVSASNVSKPGTLKQNAKFDVRGTVKTGGSKITSLTGYLYAGTATSGTAETQSTTVTPNSTTYDLIGIDASLKFQNATKTLGKHTYTVKVNLSNYHLVSGAPKEVKKSGVIVSDITTTFNVVEDPDANKVTLTLNANGGSCSPGSKSYTKGSKLGDLPDPTLTDTNAATKDLNLYYFNGWYTAKTGGTIVDSNTVINSNMTIYAHWKKSDFYGKISFDTQGGSFERIGSEEAASYTYHDYETGEDKSYSSYAAYLADNKYIYNASEGGYYRDLPVPTRAGYVFAGWGVRYGYGYGGLELSASWEPYGSAPSTAALAYNGHTYELFDYNMNWPQAKAFCESRGGYLVAITDAAEQAKVVELIQNSADVNGPVNGVYHIGLTKTSGAWKWVNGEAFSYSNWDASEPTGTPNELYSGIIAVDNPPNKQVGEWIDAPETDISSFYSISNTGFICEYEGQETAIDASLFPDDNFRSFVSTAIDQNHNGFLSDPEIKAVTRIVCSSRSIEDLTGIQLFSKLEYLDCSDNLLTSLDMSDNPELSELYCNGNQLSSLNVTQNKELAKFDCSNNQIGSLNVSSNPYLQKLNCSGNRLSALDVSSNNRLTELYCDENRLTELDVSNNSELIYLFCEWNTLYELDISKNAKLTKLYCSNNQLYSLNVSANPKLTHLLCTDNMMEYLNVSQNPALVVLECENNELERLDVTNCSSLCTLYCYGNRITQLNLLGITNILNAVKNGSRRESDGIVSYYHLNNSFAVDASVSLTYEETRPTITGHPASASVTDGQSVTFSVRASGTDLQYQWQFSTDGGSTWKNNTSTGCDTASMTFTAREAYSGRKYRCVVSNSAGSVTSNVVTLTVTAPVTKPAITTQPKDVTVYAMQTATVSLKASGTGLQYQWQYQLPGGSEWNNNTIEGCDTDTMSFPAGVGLSGRKYRCIVSNSAGSVTSYALTLTVIGKPKITTQPKNITVTAGESATLSLKATGTGLKYQWQMLTPGSTTWKNNTSAGYNTDSMTFTAREAYSGRKYRCVVTNGAGETTSNVVTLTVTAPVTKPAITTQPKDVTVYAMQTATVSLKASGTGLKYQWQYQLPGKTAWNNNTIEGCDTDTMSFQAGVGLSGRKYRCIVSNSAGSVTSYALTLTVIGKPKITTQPKNITVTAGESATLSLKASGQDLKYQWQMLTPGATTWKNNTSAGYNTASMTFTAREAYSGRKYRCLVSNAAGTTTSAAVTLTVVVKPTITTQPKSVSTTAGKSVTLSVKATGGALKYQWQYQLPGKTAWNNNTSTGYNTASMTFTARAAYSGRKYRCVVTNAAGTATSTAATLTVS